MLHPKGVILITAMNAYFLFLAYSVPVAEQEFVMFSVT